jgi:hypothetical protein
MNQKKGIPLQSAFSAVLIVLLIGVLVIVGIVLYQSLATAATPTTSTVLNEAATMTGPGNYTLSNSTDCGFTSASIINVTNSTGTLIAPGNYTFYSNGLIANKTNTFAGTWKISYLATDGGSVCTASNNMVAQFAGYVVLVGLVGTIIFLGIVIGVLVASFASGGKTL